jgi:PQQ enzyme repeat
MTRAASAPTCCTVRAFLLLAVLVASPAVSILQEHQGRYDWHRQLVGKVSSAVFAPGNRPRLYVATAHGVLAALNLRDGEVLWRQVQPCAGNAP